MISRLNALRGRVITFVREHKKMISVIVTAVISSYFLFFLVFSDLGLIKYISMKREYNRINNDISRLERENKSLKEEVGALKTDPDYIEALARERLGLVKEGEIIFRFQDNVKDENRE